MAGIEGEDEAVLSMVMQSHGSLRPQRELTGSTAKQPTVEHYPPEGTFSIGLFHSSVA